METDNAQNQNNAPASVDVNQPATQSEQALGEPAAQPVGEAPAPEAMEQQQNEENRAPISIEPPVGRFRAEGGQESFIILNPANQRYAFKVKTSNIDDWRVRPVYGFLEAQNQSELVVQRLDGPPTDDRLVIQYALAPPEVDGPRAPFQNGNGAVIGEVTLPVKGE
uniref:Major sperm protein n=1 Tax=Acrobeloides nanus TaxID=290746 RepID=A0A914DYX5_9BILA